MLQEEQHAQLITFSPSGDMRFKLTHKRFVIHRIAIKLCYYRFGQRRYQHPDNLCHLDEGIGQHAADMFHDGFLLWEYIEKPFRYYRLDEN